MCFASILPGDAVDNYIGDNCKVADLSTVYRLGLQQLKGARCIVPVAKSTL